MNIFGVPIYLDFDTFTAIINDLNITVDINFLFIGWLIFLIIYYLFWITILSMIYKVVLYVLKFFRKVL